MIRIVTDSISDLTQEEAQALGFRVLPLTVRFGNEEFRDGIDLSRDAFYTRLIAATELPQTSQITPEEFDRAFRQELQNADDEVLCITGSSKLSGTWQSAMIARNLSDSPERIHIVDSLNVSLGEATLVRLALARRSEMPDAAALKACLEDYVRRSCLIGKAEVLKYLVMGGRLSVLGGAVGSALHIQPLLRLVKGKLTQAGICRSKHRAMEWFAQQLRDVPPDPAVPLTIAHAHAPEAAAELHRYLAQALPGLPPILEMEIGIVVGTHGGPGIIGLSWIAQQENS